MKKILFSRDSECIAPIRELIEKQKHRTLVLWVFDCAQRILTIFEDIFPNDTRPREALNMAKSWARGYVKMPAAKKAIHAAHNAAAEAQNNPAAQAAARAVAHAAATVHVETHALGIVFYGLTAFVYKENNEAVVERELKWFYDRLLYWEENIDKTDMKWAPFLLRDDIPNKEKLLRQKEEKKR